MGVVGGGSAGGSVVVCGGTCGNFDIILDHWEVVWWEVVWWEVVWWEVVWWEWWEVVGGGVLRWCGGIGGQRECGGMWREVWQLRHHSAAFLTDFSAIPPTRRVMCST